MGLGAESPLERETRRAYLLLTALMVGVQGALLVYFLAQGHPITNIALSLLLTAGMTFLLFRRLLPLTTLTTLAAYLCTVWIGGQLLTVLAGLRPFSPPMTLVNSVAVLIALSWLRLRPGLVAALLLTAGMIAAVLLRAPESAELMTWTVYLNVLLVFFNLYGRRISDERLRSEVLERLAYHDPLTGALNRRGGWEKLELLMSGPRLAGGVLLVDIDHFKRINDRFGHAVGDQVLQELAQVLEGEGRVVARWGGEEFLIVLPGLALPEVEAAAQDILVAARQLRPAGVEAVPISIGIAMCSETANPDHLLALADGRMYAGKSQGGDQWRSRSG